MIFKEKEMDLFELKDKGYDFVQCISSDLGMGKGIACQFNKHFDEKNKCLKLVGQEHAMDMFQKTPGYIIHDWDNNVHNLVTKDRYYNKPTYESLTACLESLKIATQMYNIHKLAMPKIGCGLDKLDWDVVKNIIKGVFCDTNVEIQVCYL